ncbi:unnamed protein product, partial [Meganyctiphanes norvegica]
MKLVVLVLSSVTLITAQRLHWQKPGNSQHNLDYGPGGLHQSNKNSHFAQPYDWPKNISQYCDAFPDEPNPPEYPVIPERYTCKMEVLGGGQEGEPTPEHPMYSILWEEVYDEPGNRMAVDLTSTYYTEKYILNWNTQQMVQVIKSKKSTLHTDCVVSDIEEGAGLFPPIGLNFSNAHIIGPGALMGIINWTEANYKGAFQSMEKTRGITSYRWDWCGLTQLEDETQHNVSMATYWSVPEWKMPTSDATIQQIPISWEIELQHQSGKWDWIHETYVHNVISFYPHAEDPAAFLIPQGIYCADLIAPPNSSFPDFGTDRFFSFHLESRQSGIKALQNVDGWYDFEKQLYRIDHYLPSGDPPAPLQLWTEIFDFNIGIVYRFPRDHIYMCKFPSVNDTHSDWGDITGIPHLWADSPDAFFGLDQTNYTYYGKKEVRGILADEWRGIRTDWPSSDAQKPKTLWEWTFASKNVTMTTSVGEHIYQERQVPIDLSITALEDINSVGISDGSSFNYQMFDFVVDSDTRSALFTDGSIFDVYDCFSANWRDHWKFQLNITGFPTIFNTPLLSSATFTSEWQRMMSHSANVSPIRVTRVQVDIIEDTDVWIEFVILARPKVADHDLYESMTPLDKAEENLVDEVDKGGLFMEGIGQDGVEWKIVPVPGTMQKIFDQECSTVAPPTTEPQQTTPHTTGSTTTTTPHSTPSTTPHPTTTTTPHSTTTTTPHSTDSTTPHSEATTINTPSPPNSSATYTGGDLAGIGIGMLFVG